MKKYPSEVVLDIRADSDVVDEILEEIDLPSGQTVGYNGPQWDHRVSASDELRESIRSAIQTEYMGAIDIEQLNLDRISRTDRRLSIRLQPSEDHDG